MSDYTLTNFDIQRLLQGEKHFRMVAMKDQLPKVINKNEITVVNLDNQSGPGTHWVLVMNLEQDPKYVYYFDSYGVAPPKEIEEYLRTSKKQIQYSDSHLQNLLSSMCGFFVVYMAKEINKGKSFYDALYSLSQIDQSQNDKFLQSYFHV